MTYLKPKIKNLDGSLNVTYSANLIDVTANPIANLLYTTFSLTSSQIKNLHATPISVIAAPGSGKVIIPIQYMVKFIYGGNNAFVASASQTLTLQYGSDTTTGVVTLANNPTIISTSTSYHSNASAIILNLPSSSLENSGLSMYNPIATEISGNASNDNSINISCIYYIVQI